MMMNNFKTASQLEHEAKCLRSCIIDARNNLKEAKRINDAEWAQEEREAIAWFRKELKAIEAALED